jgi:hypothetical protein
MQVETFLDFRNLLGFQTKNPIVKSKNIDEPFPSTFLNFAWLFLTFYGKMGFSERSVY